MSTGRRQIRVNNAKLDHVHPMVSCPSIVDIINNNIVSGFLNVINLQKRKDIHFDE